MPAPLLLKCDQCHHVQHHKCRGRGECNCMTCHTGAIIADARTRLETSNSTQLLRASVAELLALVTQRQVRITKSIWVAGTIPFGACQCGCGEQLRGSPYGRPKQYLNNAHEMRAFRSRKKARQAA